VRQVEEIQKLLFHLRQSLVLEATLRTGPRLRAARRKEGLHGTIGFLGSSIRIETGASDWLTLWLTKLLKIANVNNSILNFKFILIL
jgi:hypothetical protein